MGGTSAKRLNFYRITHNNISAKDHCIVLGQGDGIVLENMSRMDINYNEVRSQQPNGDTLASHGIRLANSEDNYLYGNSVQAVDGFPELRNIHLAGSEDNLLCCNSTDGGGIGLNFFGPSSSEDGINNTSIGSHEVGLRCENGATIGLQEHRGNTWLTADGNC